MSSLVDGIALDATLLGLFKDFFRGSHNNFMEVWMSKFIVSGHVSVNPVFWSYKSCVNCADSIMGTFLYALNLSIITLFPSICTLIPSLGTLTCYSQMHVFGVNMSLSPG